MFFRSESVFAEEYESRDLVLPWTTWDASGSDERLRQVQAEDTLGPLEPPKRVANILLANADDNVDDDDNAKLEALALKEPNLEDIGVDPNDTNEPLDAETGCSTAGGGENSPNENSNS